jgi:DNA-binding transcriptional MerR regulator
MDRVDSALPPIPAKRYFTIGEVSELCLVKPYVLRYWEQEFVQLKPMKRRGNRRYYQHHEVLLIRRIRELLYEQGFTISGARNQLAEGNAHRHVHEAVDEDAPHEAAVAALPVDLPAPAVMAGAASPAWSSGAPSRALQASVSATVGAAWGAPDLAEMQSLDVQTVLALREALVSIRDLLA